MIITSALSDPGIEREERLAASAEARIRRSRKAVCLDGRPAFVVGGCSSYIHYCRAEVEVFVRVRADSLCIAQRLREDQTGRGGSSGSANQAW